MTQAVALAQQASTGVSQGFKNRIINGAMTISQSAAGAAVTVNGFAVYPVDRFFGSFRPSTGTATAQQVSDAPAGFVNSLRMTQASVTSAAASDIYSVIQRIEGFNTADLNWGSANAKTVTLSFWVKSSVTGIYGLTLQNINATRRAYVTTYTVSSANTWEYKTITVAGDTTGTWETTNSTGIAVLWDLGSGSDYQTATLNAWQTANVFQANTGTRWIATSGATWQITGVQLEVGSTATSFEYLDYGRSLIQCQRYFYQTNRYIGLTQASDTLYGPAIAFPVTMRTTPTLNAGATFTARTGSNGTPLISSGVTGIVATNDAVAVYNSSSNWSTNTWVSFNGGFTAEL